MNEDIFYLGVKALIRNDEGKLLLLKVNVKDFKNHTGSAYWDIPGGRVQKDCSVEETLKKELAEELGNVILCEYMPFAMVLSPLRIPQGNSSVGLILSAYLCQIEGLDRITLSEEHTTYAWFPPKEATMLLKVKYPQEFVEKINNAIFFSRTTDSFTTAKGFL